MHGDYLIAALAIGTIVIATVVAVWQRTRVAQKKHDPERSAFLANHGDAPRPNRPGTEHT